MDQKNKENNYAFIDSQNLNLGVQRMGWKLDFTKFHRHLKDRFRVSKAFIFIGYIKQNKSLYSYLEKAGYELIYKPVVQNPQKHDLKGNVDAELVLQTMHELCEGNFDKAVIVSGDGDFRCLVEYLVQRDKLKAIVAPRRQSTSTLLTKKYSKHIQYLNDKQKKLKR